MAHARSSNGRVSWSTVGSIALTVINMLILFVMMQFSERISRLEETVANLPPDIYERYVDSQNAAQDRDIEELRRTVERLHGN